MRLHNITNLTTTAALTTVENKIPNVSNLVEKTDYNTKTSKIKNKITIDHDRDKYNTTQEFNKLTAEDFTGTLTKANLVIINDFANFVKKTYFYNKLKALNKNVTSDKN